MSNACNCDDEMHECLGVNQDKSDKYGTVYYYICQMCGHEWEE